jgi:hypothetical protein
MVTTRWVLSSARGAMTSVAQPARPAAARRGLPRPRRNEDGLRPTVEYGLTVPHVTACPGGVEARGGPSGSR